MVAVKSIKTMISDEMFIALIIGISLLDIFANSMSAVPVLGTLAAAVSESALEGIQIILVLLFGGKAKVT